MSKMIVLLQIYSLRNIYYTINYAKYVFPFIPLIKKMKFKIFVFTSTSLLVKLEVIDISVEFINKIEINSKAEKKY